MRKTIVFIILTCALFLLISCASEEVLPTPVVTNTAIPTDIPTSTPTLPSTATPTPAPTSTPTATDTPVSTDTPMPTTTPTSTAHPLAINSHQIVFVSDEDGDADIYILNADGTDLRNLTNNDIPDSFPAVSADGQKLAFASIVNDGPDLFVMDLDGDNLIQITNGEGSNFMPTWSPDGQSVAFVSDRDGDLEIFTVNVDGTGLTQITNNETEDVFPAWSPNGEWIAFSTSISGNPDIYIVHPDGTNLKQITFSNNYDGDVATWSPDGNWVTFVSERIGNKEIYAVSINDGQFGALTQTEEDEMGGALSPDNQYLLRETATENSNDIVINSISDIEIAYSPLPESMQGWFASWVPNPKIEILEPQLTFQLPPEGFCIYETDETFGHTLDNPTALGTTRLFGGPFASTYGDVILRGLNGEAIIFNDGDLESSAPSAVNEDGDIVAVYKYEISDGTSGVLYLNTHDHSIPHIPTGFSCDLEWP
jgi:TolB protein